MYHHITDDDVGIAGKYDNFLEFSVKVFGKTTGEVRRRFAPQSSFHYERQPVSPSLFSFEYQGFQDSAVR